MTIKKKAAATAKIADIPAMTDEQLLALREFLKHGPTGEIWAVEWLDDKKVKCVAGRRCSRPTEQTVGALPVLVLDEDLDTIGYLDEHLVEMAPWTPPMAPTELFDAILKAAAVADEKKRVWKEAQAYAKSYREEWDESVEALQELIRQARDGKAGVQTLPFSESEADHEDATA